MNRDTDKYLKQNYKLTLQSRARGKRRGRKIILTKNNGSIFGILMMIP